MKHKTIKALKASTPYLLTGFATVCVLLVPEVADASTGFTDVDRILRMIPIAVAGVGGYMGIKGLGSAAIRYANDGAGHGDEISRGIRAGVGGGTAVGIGVVGNQVIGGLGFSMADAALHVAMTGGGF